MYATRNAIPHVQCSVLTSVLSAVLCSASMAVLCSYLISCFGVMLLRYLLSDTDILVTLGAFLLPVFSYFFPGCRGGVRQSCVVVSEGLQSTADCNWALGLAVNENSPFDIETRRMWSDIEDHHLDFFGPKLRGVVLQGWRLSIISSRRGPRDVTLYYLVMLCSGSLRSVTLQRIWRPSRAGACFVVLCKVSNPDRALVLLSCLILYQISRWIRG